MHCFWDVIQVKCHFNPIKNVEVVFSTNKQVSLLQKTKGQWPTNKVTPTIHHTPPHSPLKLCGGTYNIIVP